MKKVILSTVLISLLAAGMIFTGCASSPSKGTAQMVITITGIPAQYQNMVGGLILDTGGSDNVAWSMPTTISGGVNENYMLDWVTDTAWGKDGTYRIIYVIYTDSNLVKDTASSFVITSRSLTQNVTIPFTQFIAVD